jgi:glutathione synthase
MKIRIGVVMDPIQSIKIHKDSTFAMMLEIQRRGWEMLYIEQNDLYLLHCCPYARVRPVTVKDDPSGWYELGEAREIPLFELDVILMRKDPPFDMEYIYTTQLLELAEREGTLVVNRPQALRDANEKLATAWFPECRAPTLVSRDPSRFKAFIAEQGDVVVKPLDGMGGASIFRINQGDQNTNVILETLTEHGSRFAMAQRFIPEISAGDKRILMIDGEPVPYALARLPAPGEHRGNLAAGGRGEGIPLSERDRFIAAKVGPTLRERGILFAGLDVIGDYLTEVNVTSPTCIRELDAQFGLNISAQLMDCIEEKLAQCP